MKLILMVAVINVLVGKCKWNTVITLLLLKTSRNIFIRIIKKVIINVKLLRIIDEVLRNSVRTEYVTQSIMSAAVILDKSKYYVVHGKVAIYTQVPIFISQSTP